MTAIKESVQTIRRLLNGEAVTFEGRFLKMKDARLSFKPAHEIPIYIGAQGPKMLKLSSKIGDGILINASNPKDFEYAMGIIKEAASEKLEKLDIALARGDFKKAFKNVTEDMVKAFSIYGTPEDCIKSIKELLNIGVTHVVFGSPLGAKKKKALRLIGENVIPAFK